MGNCYIFRIDYGDNYKLIRNELINKHLLRQGWGTYDMPINLGFESFKKGWQKHWSDDNYSDEAMLSRFNNLLIMTEIEPGDIIIIPKVSTKDEYVSRSFTIARCKEKYRFSVLDKAKDFGHIIEVEDVFSCGYDKNLLTQNIKSKFRAYQSPINRVKNESIIEAVGELVALHDKQPEDFEKESNDFISMVDNATSYHRNLYLQEIKTAPTKMGNKEFENLIGELFEKNGYSLIAENQYDGQGADADLIFECFNKNSLMYNIFDICDVNMPHIYVQAKKKVGIDSGDIVGVEQLLKTKENIPKKNAILIVINLTDRFNDEAKELAKASGIILVDGITFASLLVRYGIEVDIS